MRTRRAPARRLLLGVLLLAGPALACVTGPATDSTTTTNAVWGCPTATPLPTVSPIPTTCVAVAATPNAAGTPGPVAYQCSRPAPTATPPPTATPYGRWLSPGDRGTTSTFYLGQDVRMGGLLVRLESYTTRPIPGGATMAHVFAFHTQNEGRESLDEQWPLQVFVGEVTAGDGTSTAGTWWETPAAERAAGLPAWTLPAGVYGPQESKDVTVAVEGPAGQAHAAGFVPDVWSGGARDRLGNAAHVVWFLPQADPYCGGQNTSGPPRQGDGGAVYPKALPAPAPVLYGYFAGWPVAPNGPWTISQGFGCTDFRELSGYNCPNARPWFHSGIDVAAAEGTPLLSVVAGVVVYVGPSSGTHECTFPGAEPPRYNLGIMVEIQPVDATGRPAGFHVKYGHLLIGSPQVQIGARVTPGQVIGRMGSTGCSTGPHTHLRMQTPDGRFLDPLGFIGPPRR